MENLNTIQGNKLITEFMEVKPSKFGERYNYSDSPFFYVSEDSEEKTMQAICQYVKYSTSWDWLMPVVAKIEELGFIFYITRTYCEVDSNFETTPEYKMEYSGHDKLLNVYVSVVEFLKWYKINK